jgi:tagaturonate reductase
MTNLQMWGQDLTQIPGFEAATVANLKKIRAEGAHAAYASCL